MSRTPEGFAAVAGGLLRGKLDEQLAAGIRHEPALETTQMAEAKRSLYDRLAVDSEVERKFAGKLEPADGVTFYLKPPLWSAPPTPLGTYSPDWAFVWRYAGEFGDGGKRLVLVRET